MKIWDINLNETKTNFPWILLFYQKPYLFLENRLNEFFLAMQ